MNEKEKNSTKEQLLKEAYEMTKNQWYFVTVRELSRAILYKVNSREDLKREWIRREAFQEDRQLEVIHLIYLIGKMDKENLERVGEQLKQFEPNQFNDIQPLYIPEQESSDPQLLEVVLDSGYKLVITQHSFLFKTPTEI
jgi:hypothetical protein